MDKKLLEGIRVIDFSWAFVGPRTAKMLGDYGAEVLRLESSTRPEQMRIMGPFKDNIRGFDRSGGFTHCNTSKLSAALNLSHPKGVEIAKRFVAQADIVIETYAGGAIKRMGLGYEELKKVKPDIIMLSSCALGQTGPGGNQPGYGGPLTSISGFNYITGWPDRQPADVGQYTDFIAPHYNVFAILAALQYRRRTGKGVYLDMSQFENAIHFVAPLVLEYATNRRVANRMGNRCIYAVPHNAYRCRGEDRWCTIAVYDDEEWKNFCEVIGNPPWTKKPQFSTLLARKKNEEELDRLVEEWTINHSANEVMTMMQEAGVAAGVVQNTEDILEHDPQLKHLHFFWQVDHPIIGKHYSAASPFVLSKSPCELKPAPLLGEHNEYAYKEILGMSDEEIAELVIEGVIS